MTDRVPLYVIVKGRLVLPIIASVCDLVEIRGCLRDIDNFIVVDGLILKLLARVTAHTSISIAQL